jgi:hypothetical protein
MLKLNDPPMDLAYVHRVLYLSTKEYAPFSEPHRAFFKTDIHILGHKANLNKYKEI